MIQVLHLDELVDVMTYDLVGRHAKEDQLLSSEGILRPCQCQPTSAQTLKERESAFSLPLSTTRYFFGRGIISSIEVSRDAVLIASWTEATVVTGVPFSTTCTTLFPRLERGSFFFTLILAYISWLNFVVISAEEKHFVIYIYIYI